MKSKIEKISSVSSLIFLILTVWFGLMTRAYNKAEIAAQKQIPPPPPDDYLGALAYAILYYGTQFFGLFFGICLTVWLVSYANRRASATVKSK